VSSAETENAPFSSLGVTVEGAREESERMLTYALSSIGISVEDICREAGDAFDMSLPDERRIPFSPRAKAVLEWTLRETVWLRANNIGPEHVLPGILDNEHGTAVKMLGRMGVSPEVLEERLFELRSRVSG
jgi:ATP-dependent Clp protease ATP-binding subunit ClpC